MTSSFAAMIHVSDVCVREIFILGETRMECARTQYELALRTPRMDV